MNEQNKKQVIIAVVLGVVLLGVLVYQFVLVEAPAPPTDPSPRPERPAHSTAPTPAVVEEPDFDDMDIQALIESVEVRPIDYPQERIARNPFTPLVGILRPGQMTEPGEEEASEVLTQIQVDLTASKQVSGIIWDEVYPVAIVDDVVVHVGYVFPNGVQVERIEPTRVLFKVSDTIIPVEMKEF